MVWTNPSQTPHTHGKKWDVGIMGRSSYSGPASGFLERQGKGPLRWGTIEKVKTLAKETLQQNTESASTTASFPPWLVSMACNPLTGDLSELN